MRSSFTFAKNSIFTPRDTSRSCIGAKIASPMPAVIVQ